MAENSINAVLSLEYIAFESIEYHRDIRQELPADQTYSMNFSRDIQENRETQQYKVSLEANIWSNDSDVVKLRVKIFGIFSCQHEDQAIKDRLLSKNAVAILFPYLRSQISLVTTQPNNVPIMIPAININALFDEANKQE